ncbi:MAG: hypothetical protein IPH62_06325 [Ignavibacteriae bacterium]|nr:hypothetical protein [Ignavibacteriota bacterium]
MDIEIDFSLLEKLTTETKPNWGIMTAQHMIEHLILAVKTSNGKFSIDKCLSPPDKYPILKRFLQSSKPLPKDFVNPVLGEGLQPLIYSDLDSAKDELKLQIEEFYNYFKENPSAQPMNATFGPLNFDEWKIFHTKHFTHHFTQFGLI